MFIVMSKDKEIWELYKKYNLAKKRYDELENVGLYECSKGSEYNCNFYNLLEEKVNEMENEKKFIVQDKETGTVIEKVESLELAKELIKKYEDEDKKNEIYEEDFYEIYDKNLDSVVF